MKKMSGSGDIKISPVSVSVIIPTLNEKENIVQLISYVCLALLHTNVKRYEVIVVDDSSFNGTPTVVKMLAEKDSNIKLVCRPGRMGLGSAIMDGIKHSIGEVIIPIDADFSHPPNFIPVLLRRTSISDIVVGSRYVKGGKMKAPFMRVFLSKVLNCFIRWMLGLQIRDCTGGFMAVKRHIFNFVNVEGKEGDYAFELLYKAHRLGFKIMEIPFVYEYRKRGASKINFISWGLKYMFSTLLLRLRCAHFR